MNAKLPEATAKTRLLLVSIVPPRNDNGVRIVMHRHLVARTPFELHVASSADFADDLLVHTRLRLPYILERLSKTRLSPLLSRWVHAYRNLVWSRRVPEELDRCIESFRPDVILTLAETSVCHIAAKAARKHRIPLAGLFLDWFPIMEPHFGFKVLRGHLGRRYRELYRQCDLAICTSDGMKEVLGDHPNSHVVYPMPGNHRRAETIHPPRTGRFRVVYVGSVRNFYGRMLSALVERFGDMDEFEIIVAGANADWPPDVLERARRDGVYLGFVAPERAAEVLEGADALLVVMSFEPEHERFMRTSFTTKFLDYSTFHKPIVLWAPEYCTPMRVVRREGGALPVVNPDPDSVIDAVKAIQSDPDLRQRFSDEARRLNETTFNADRLQQIFVSELEAIAERKKGEANGRD